MSVEHFAYECRLSDICALLIAVIFWELQMVAKMVPLTLFLCKFQIRLKVAIGSLHWLRWVTYTRFRAAFPDATLIPSIAVKIKQGDHKDMNSFWLTFIFSRFPCQGLNSSAVPLFNNSDLKVLGNTWTAISFVANLVLFCSEIQSQVHASRPNSKPTKLTRTRQTSLVVDEAAGE